MMPPLGPGLDQNVAPLRVEAHHRRIRELDVIGTRIEMSKPPRLLSRMLAEQRQHGLIVARLLRLSADGSSTVA